MPQVIYPRASVRLLVIVRRGSFVKQVNTNVIPDSVQIQRGSHKHAATCSVTLRGASLPFDPDHVDDGFIAVNLADVGSMDGEPHERPQTRFFGYLDEFERDDNDRGATIQAKARDLSALLRAPMVLDPSAIPRYEDEPFDALNNILQSALRQLKAIDNRTLADVGTLVLKKTAALESASLANLVAGKHKKGPVLMPKAKISPWEAMEHLCGMMARLIRVNGQDIEVLLPAEVFGEDGADKQSPVLSFLFGDEDEALPDAPAPIVPAMSVKRTRKLRSTRRGVACTAWDTATGKTLYVEYPDKDHLPAKVIPPQGTQHGAVHAFNRAAHEKAKAARGASAAGHAKGQPAAAPPKEKFVKESDRDAFYIRSGVHSEKELLEIAASIYKQRSRQELEGRIETHDFSDTLLDLSNGDRVTLHIAPSLQTELGRREFEDEKIAFLVERLGLDPKSAAVLLRAGESPGQSLFYVKSVGINWYKDQKPSVSVEFLNLLTVQVAKHSSTSAGFGAADLAR